jgi:chlorobactene glucosyltransferase
VDDGSDDGTGEIARSYGVRVVRNDGPSPGWTGKTHACHSGAQASSGEWLLFVDADTRHHPHGPACTVAYALARNLHGLSLFLPNITSGGTDRLALMAAFASFFAAVGPSSSVLNGQYILLRRDVYEESQGFSAVRDQVTEDLALGYRLRSMGYHIPILRGDGMGTVRMYHDTSQLWPGLSRFAVASLRWTGLGGLWAILLTVFVAAPIELMLWALFSKQGLWSASLAWVTTALAMSGWAARFGGRRWTILAPLGAMQVQLAAIYGIVRRLLGRGVPWKGRVL